MWLFGAKQSIGRPRKKCSTLCQRPSRDGMGYFFNREDNRGQCHKFTTDKKAQAQELLDTGYSQQRTAKKLWISEIAIRYHLRAGSFKKKFNSNQ